MRTSKFRHLATVGLIGLGCFLSVATFIEGKAYAGPGGRSAMQGYFTGNNYATCSGAADNCGAVLSDGIPSSAYSKSGFVSYIKRLHNGGGSDAIGADFIIQLMRPGNDHSRVSSSDLAEWEDLVNQDSVSVRVAVADYGGWNSARTKVGTTDEVFYQTSGSARSLIFSQNGSDVFKIKLECGNPLGDMAGLTETNQKPAANIYSVRCTYVHGWAYDPDHPTSKVTVDLYLEGISQGTQTAGGTYSTTSPHPGHDFNYDLSAWMPNHLNNSSVQVTIKVKDLDDGKWYVGDTYTYNAQANCNPNPQPQPSPSVSCPALPGYDITKIGASFPSGEPSDSRPWNPSEGTTYVTRSVTSRHITSAYDIYTGRSAPYAQYTVDFSNAVSNAPYDTNYISTTYINEYDLTVWTYKSGVWTSTTRHYSTSAVHSGSATLGACYFRTFNIEPQGGSASFDNPEYPSRANITDSIRVTFGFDGPTPGVVRSPSCVYGIGTSVNATVDHADGAPAGPYPYGMTSSSFPSGFCGSTAYPTSTGYGSASATYGASIPNLRYGDSICFILTETPGSGKMRQDGTIVVRGGPASDIRQTCSGRLAARPYLRVFGGDIAVGGGVQQTNGIDAPTTCTPSSGATINAWNKGPAGAYAGSGAQYAVQALGTINGFASALNNRSSNPYTRPPIGLSLANTSGGYGGGFGAVPGCKDYVNNLPKNAQKFPGNIQVSGLQLSAGDHLTYYVTGNAYISNDVVYTNSGSWTRPEDIPTFKLIVVGGNIYISPEVHQLDGLYVAVKNTAGLGGTIYTCAYSTGPMTGSRLFDDCSDKLTVNGSFAADRVELLRTRGQNGTNYQSNPNETPSSPYPAEVFNYTPEEWIAGPPNTFQDEYDSVTSLAPVL